LQSLYLDPLRAYIREHNGRVYPDHELLLLIDIKTAADSTYEILREVLNNYADILTAYTAEQIKRRAVSVVISGNRPRRLMYQEGTRYATYDGRLADLDSEMPPNFMILISDNWQRHFKWRGKKPMSAAERAKLAQIVAGVHTKGCRIRFWNLPDNDPVSLRTVWTVLISAGVDLISVDDLRAYRNFLIYDYAD